MDLNFLDKIYTKVNSSFDQDDIEGILGDILEVSVEIIGFEFATIQIVDHIKKTISTVMAKKNERIVNAIDPNAWITEREHSLYPQNEKITGYSFVVITGSQVRNNY